MSPDATVSVLKEAISVLIAVSMPLLLVGLFVGLAVSLFQAATQVQEASLVFVPKLLAVIATFWFTAPWSAQKLVTFVHQVFDAVSGAGAGGGGVIG